MKLNYKLNYEYLLINKKPTKIMNYGLLIKNDLFDFLGAV